MIVINSKSWIEYPIFHMKDCNKNIYKKEE